MYRPLCLFFILITLLLVSVNGLPSEEFEALQDMRDSWSGLQSVWTGSLDEACSWTGISCSGSEENVIMINIISVILDNPIPATISNFSKLTHLVIAGNTGPNGTIPDSLWSLESLVALNLQQTQLTGTISPLICELQNIQYITISSNPSLVGEIPDCFEAESIKVIEISNNPQIEGSIPNSLANLFNLEQLTIQANDLSGAIPNELFSAATKLKKIYIHQNRISGEIPDPSPLTDLEVFSAYGNELEGLIPLGFQNLPKLWELNLFSNKMNMCNPEVSNLPPLLTPGTCFLNQQATFSCGDACPSATVYENCTLATSQLSTCPGVPLSPVSSPSATPVSVPPSSPIPSPVSVPSSPIASPVSVPISTPIDISSPNLPPSETPVSTTPMSSPIPSPGPAPVSTPTSTPTTVGCQQAPPNPNFNCVNGIWTFVGNLDVSGTFSFGSEETTIEGDLNIAPGSITTIGGSLTIQGDFVLSPGAVLKFSNFVFSGSSKRVDSVTPRIATTGCASLNGSIDIALTRSEIDALESSSTRSARLVESQSCELENTPLRIETDSSDCRKTSATSSVSGTSPSRLTAIFAVDRSDCKKSNTWWIVLVSVVGGVVFLVLLAVLIGAFVPSARNLIRPFHRARRRSISRRTTVITANLTSRDAQGDTEQQKVHSESENAITEEEHDETEQSQEDSEEEEYEEDSEEEDSEEFSEEGSEEDEEEEDSEEQSYDDQSSQESEQDDSQDESS